MIKFNLLQFVEIKRLQEIFDLFRELTGVTIAFAIQSLLQDEDSYSCNFCKNCVKKSEKGRALCNKNFKQYVKEMTFNDKVVPFKCHAGLIDIVAPIKINDKTVSFIVSGQVLDSKHNIEEAKKHAKELEIDEVQYLKEYKKVKYFNPKKMKTLLKYIEKLAALISADVTKKL